MDDVESVLRRLGDFELWLVVKGWRDLLRLQRTGSLPAPVRSGYDFSFVHCPLLRFLPGVTAADPAPLQQMLAGVRCVRALFDRVAYLCPASNGCEARTWRQLRDRMKRGISESLS